MCSSCHSQNSQAHRLSLWSIPLTEHIYQNHKPERKWNSSFMKPRMKTRTFCHTGLIVNTTIDPLQNRGKQKYLTFSKVNFIHRHSLGYNITKSIKAIKSTDFSGAAISLPIITFQMSVLKEPHCALASGGEVSAWPVIVLPGKSHFFCIYQLHWWDTWRPSSYSGLYAI